MFYPLDTEHEGLVDSWWVYTVEQVSIVAMKAETI